MINEPEAHLQLPTLLRGPRRFTLAWVLHAGLPAWASGKLCWTQDGQTPWWAARAQQAQHRICGTSLPVRPGSVKKSRSRDILYIYQVYDKYNQIWKSYDKYIPSIYYAYANYSLLMTGICLSYDISYKIVCLMTGIYLVYDKYILYLICLWLSYDHLVRK